MAPEKKNEFLDAGDESDSDAGYNSEDDDLRKGSGRSAKRRRVDSDDDNSDHESDHSSPPSDDEDEDDDAAATQLKNEAQLTKPSSKPPKSSSDLSLPTPSSSKPLAKKNLVVTESAIKKSGVVYISRIPPFMKPQKLRSLLEPYGKINRMFLAPEDPASHSRRVKAGGNKKRTYTEGWVEFVSKKDAKKVCELLNAQTIGGKKGSYYRDDIWNLLYLKGFKWHNLTEQIAAENAERASRMRAEISKTTKENKEFARNVERGKILDTKQSKQEKRQQKKTQEGARGDQGNVGGTTGGITGGEKGGDKGGTGEEERKRTFKQIPLAKKRKAEEQPEQVQRVLSKIF
ncbi:RNA-binding ATPase activator esf2 [Diplogelasinospora grovesii]|uniref:18S rRNA factor 2 n=1 Tax=Diplogelasinospora grovesii TaxID=303347 RepID=A0AAN6MZ68_9PEZI|nr:RNA-binding ATPase activator esf2 [Diplogelasinospora grovesii]